MTNNDDKSARPEASSNLSPQRSQQTKPRTKRSQSKVLLAHSEKQPIVSQSKPLQLLQRRSIDLLLLKRLPDASVACRVRRPNRHRFARAVGKQEGQRSGS